MNKLLTFFLLLPCLLKAQQKSDERLGKMLMRLQVAVDDTAKVRLLYDVANYYSSIDSVHASLRYLLASERLSDKIHYRQGYMTALYGQTYLYYVMGDRVNLQKKYNLMNDTSQVWLYWRLSRYYQSKSTFTNTVRDSAYSCLLQAKIIGEATHNNYLIAETLYRLALYNYGADELVQGEGYAQEAASLFRRIGKPASAPFVWLQTAKKMNATDRYYPAILVCLENAVHGYLAARDTLRASNVSTQKADIYVSQGNLVQAEWECNRALAWQQQIGFSKSYYIYSRLYDIYHIKGDFEKALFYAMECVKRAEADNVKKIEHLYARLGYTYFELGQTDKSIEVFEKVMVVTKRDTVPVPGLAIKGLAKALILKERKEEALHFVRSIPKENPGYAKVDLMLIEESLGNCYYALGQIDTAEMHYRNMHAIAVPLHVSDGLSSYYGAGQFYYNIHRYAQADTFLAPLLKKENEGMVPKQLQADVHFMLYKMDSARQDYLSAIHHLRLHKQLKENILNETSNRQVAELGIRYDIDKKNKDLLLKDQAILLKEKDIELLTKQNLLQQAAALQKNKDLVLKQARIEFLRKETELQKLVAEKNDRGLKLQKKDFELLKGTSALQAAELKQAAVIRKITIGGIALLVIILLLLYNQYRTKQRNVREANMRNNTLEGLLQEKEWLVREVHHRVKNNLQVMLSLLESQSAYLQNEALAANLDTLHRIQAMSLIHQRLYQAENISTIDMRLYIAELVKYLEDSYKTQKYLVFRLDVAAVQLDVSRAVPLGLIINEAITNSIKHAFHAAESGIVSVSLQLQEGNMYVLTIADNGSGLPVHFDIQTTRSLGTKLIKGLSLEINGSLCIENKAGTSIQLRFGGNMGQAA